MLNPGSGVSAGGGSGWIVAARIVRDICEEEQCDELSDDGVIFADPNGVVSIVELDEGVLSFNELPSERFDKLR